jgi:hypothetical protein
VIEALERARLAERAGKLTIKPVVFALFCGGKGGGRSQFRRGDQRFPGSCLVENAEGHRALSATVDDCEASFAAQQRSVRHSGTVAMLDPKGLPTDHAANR